MTLKDDIHNKVRSILDEKFTTNDVYYIPSIDDTKLTFGNTGLKFDATTLFIDMRGSTTTLNKHNKSTVAKIHSAYFHAIVKIANSNNGHIRSFNGDSALIFFQGTTKDNLSNAVLTALKIKYILSDNTNGINSLLKKYSEVNFGIGIDYGNILCTKIGIGGQHNRDLFWVGNSVNKSTIIGNECRFPNHVGISNLVYHNLNDNAKYLIIKNFLGIEERFDIWTQATFSYNGQLEYYYYTHYHYVVP